MQDVLQSLSHSPPLTALPHLHTIVETCFVSQSARTRATPVLHAQTTHSRSRIASPHFAIVYTNLFTCSARHTALESRHKACVEAWWSSKRPPSSTSDLKGVSGELRPKPAALALQSIICNVIGQPTISVKGISLASPNRVPLMGDICCLCSFLNNTLMIENVAINREIKCSRTLQGRICS